MQNVHFSTTPFGRGRLPEVVRLRVELVRRDRRLAPVEVARAVRAGRHAVAAADAPVVVDHDDAVRLRPGGAGRADLRARRVAALLARHRHVEVALLGHLGGLVVGVGVREVDALLLLHREHADPVDLRVARLVVLLDAGVARSGGSRCSARCRARRRTARRACAAVSDTVTALPYFAVYSRSMSASACLQPLLRAPRAGACGPQAVSTKPAAAAAAQVRELARAICRRASSVVHGCSSPSLAGAAALRRRLGRERLEARLVRVVAVRAQQVASCGRSSRRVRRPCTPARQSRSFSPWHWPHSRYDSSNDTRSPLARCSLSRSVASWQSRHQRCCLVVLQHDVGVHVGQRRGACGSSGMPAWQVGAGEDALGERRRRHLERAPGAPLGATAGRAEPARRRVVAAQREAADARRAPATARTRRVTGLAHRLQLDHALHLAQPHRLEHLQPLADDRGDVARDGVADGRVRGEVARAAPRAAAPAPRSRAAPWPSA